jgi:hypothetical protein
MIRDHDPSNGPDSRARDGRAGSWSGFFFFTGIATLLGAAKHGIPHYLAPVPLDLTVLASGFGSGIGVFYAEVATLQAHFGPGPLRRWLRRGALAQLAVFALVLALNRSFIVVTVNTALGLVPVMVAEYLAFRRGNRRAGWVAGGLAFSSVTALVYLLKLSVHPWFDHNDLAHVMMMASLLLIYRGVRVPREAHARMGR